VCMLFSLFSRKEGAEVKGISTQARYSDRTIFLFLPSFPVCERTGLLRDRGYNVMEVPLVSGVFPF